jgi:hypothetical protein
MAAPNSGFLAAIGAVPSTVRFVGRSKNEDHLRRAQAAPRVQPGCLIGAIRWSALGEQEHEQKKSVPPINS